MGVLGKADGEVSALAHLHREGGVADVGDFEGLTLGGIDGEIAVDVGHHANGGALDFDRCSDDGLSVGFIDHRSGDFRLGEGL